LPRLSRARPRSFLSPDTPLPAARPWNRHTHASLSRRCAMPCLRHYVGPSWPPRVGAYDYALALCHSDLAWEFLRRNPDYQRDYRLSRRGVQHARRLKSGHQLTRIRRHTQRSAKWGLHPFCRSGDAGARSSRLLDNQCRCSNPRRHLRSPDGRVLSRPFRCRSPFRRKPNCRTCRRRNFHPPRLRQRCDTTASWLARVAGAGQRQFSRLRDSATPKIGGKFWHSLRSRALSSADIAPFARAFAPARRSRRSRRTMRRCKLP
jgi:hypothetical protein